MKKSTIYLFIPVLALAVIVVSTGLVTSAQNSNSSTTMSNSTMAPMKHSSRRTSKPKKTAPADDSTAAATEDVQVRTGRCDPMKQEQADLSGTYNGKIKHGDEAAMDATLTITGNNFTMTSGSETHSGRVTAVTTCGYTAATFMMGDLNPPSYTTSPPPNKAMSLRAKKVGNGLTLMSAPGEPEKVVFTSGGGSMRPRRHRMSKPAASPSPTPQQ